MAVMLSKMRIVDIHTAKAQLFRLVERAVTGEEIIISKAGTPRAKLVPLKATDVRRKRRLGSLAGRLLIPEDFDTPLPSKTLDAFEGQNPGAPKELKALLAAAPLENVDLDRSHDLGRDNKP
jgi:prevent-host-death family protein